jgi:hypothetical protein
MFFDIFVAVKNLLFILLFSALSARSQTFSNDKFGVSLGYVLNLGTHVDRMGLFINAYYHDHFYQVNAGTLLTLNLKGYGGRKRFWETRNHLGIVLLAGKRQMDPDFQLDGLLHNSRYNYGLGYNYIWYFDNAGTTQRSGGWSAHVKRFSVLFENDVFGGQAKDRFRTGHLAFNYRYDRFKFSGGLYIWTGETARSVWQKVPLDKCPSGFRILEDLPYGRSSHGILYGGVTYDLGMGQNLQARLGVDSEHIRHGFQNRLIHDLLFLPPNIERNTPHYPRLDENGCAVFEKDSVRRDRLYFQFGSNENWSN